MFLCTLKCNDFYFYLSNLTTFPTSFDGHCSFTLKCEFLSIIWLFPSFIYDCYDWMLQILSLTLKYVCFTMISTFNLTPLATDTTGWGGLYLCGLFYCCSRLCPVLPVSDPLSCCYLCLVVLVVPICVSRLSQTLSDWLIVT